MFFKPECMDCFNAKKDHQSNCTKPDPISKQKEMIQYKQRAVCIAVLTAKSFANNITFLNLSGQLFCKTPLASNIYKQNIITMNDAGIIEWTLDLPMSFIGRTVLVKSISRKSLFCPYVHLLVLNITRESLFEPFSRLRV